MATRYIWLYGLVMYRTVCALDGKWESIKNV